MSVNNQTNNSTNKHKSHTIILQYPHKYSHHDDMHQYGTTTSSLCSQRNMFNEATSFDQDLSSWDVSKGTLFVSNVGAIRICCLLFLSFCVVKSLCCWSIVVAVRVLLAANACNTLIVMV